MILAAEQRAQRWHDTDHGPTRPPARRTYGRQTLRPEPEPDWVSSCWCCCTSCDPDANPTRFNPYFTQAQDELRTLLKRSF